MSFMFWAKKGAIKDATPYMAYFNALEAKQRKKENEK